jgi:hypothetical protein
MNLIVIALCLAGIHSGDLRCIDTSLVSRAYIDCVDDPAMSAIGNPDRGSGFIRWGSRFGTEFEDDGSALYEWSGWQVVPGGYARAIIGVDEDRVFGDGMDRECREGWF